MAKVTRPRAPAGDRGIWQLLECLRTTVTLFDRRRLHLVAAQADLLVFRSLEDRILEDGRLRGLVPTGTCWEVALGEAGTRGFRERVAGMATSGSYSPTVMELILGDGRRCWSGEWRLLGTGQVLISGNGQPEQVLDPRAVDGRGT